MFIKRSHQPRAGPSCDANVHIWFLFVRHQATKSADNQFFVAVKTLFSMERWVYVCISSCCFPSYVLTMWTSFRLSWWMTVSSEEISLMSESGATVSLKVGVWSDLRSRNSAKGEQCCWFNVKHLFSHWYRLYDLTFLVPCTSAWLSSPCILGIMCS